MKRDQALKHYRAGNEHFSRSLYAQALPQYEKAVALWAHPAFLYNLGVCQIHLKRLLAAQKSFTRALRFGPKPLGQHAKQAGAYLMDLAGKLVTLIVRCDQAGAVVSLGGRELFVGPGQKTVVLKPGRYMVVARKKGFIPTTKNVTLESGLTHTETLKLLPMSAAGPKFRKVRRWSKWLPWSLLGSGLALAVVASGLIADANSTMTFYNAWFADNCDSETGCLVGSVPASVEGRPKRARLERGFAGAMFGLGGAAAAAGAVFLLLKRHKLERLPGAKPAARAKRLRLEFDITPLPGGFAISSHFRF